MLPYVRGVGLGQNHPHGSVDILDPTVKIKDEDPFLHSPEEGFGLGQVLDQPIHLFPHGLGHAVQLISQAAQFVPPDSQTHPPVEKTLREFFHYPGHFVQRLNQKPFQGDPNYGRKGQEDNQEKRAGEIPLRALPFPDSP